MSGDEEFAKLVDLHYGSLYRFALSLARSEADACDLVQETFYIWVRKGSQLREERKVKSWLFTTLHREFLQRRRRSTRFPELELSDAQQEAPVTPAGSMDRLDGRHLVQLIHELDPAFRAPLLLFYLEDLSYDEIASTLELPLGTVKSRLSRGISQLRNRVAGDLDLERGGRCE